MCSAPLHLYQLPVRHRLQVDRSDRSKGQKPSTKILPLTVKPPTPNTKVRVILFIGILSVAIRLDTVEQPSAECTAILTRVYHPVTMHITCTEHHHTLVQLAEE